MLDDKQGTPVVVYLADDEKDVVTAEKKQRGFSNQNMAIRQIIRNYGDLPDISFGGYKDDRTNKSSSD